ncbi:MAG: thioredoxin family protein [Armatimonadetes bacterium]|nr:thioredoxin family protein [Armatimonadota bacterium]
MGGKQLRREGRISKALWWAKSNWQILLFWFACAFAGWYLGAKGYGMALYFRITGINPEEWIPILRLAAQKDPKVGTQISLDGLVDWNGKPMKLPYSEKMTGLLFICSQCGMEEKLAAFYEFYQSHANKLQMIVVYVGQPSEELFDFWRNFKGLDWARDPNLTVFERLNVLYMPRFYLIAPDKTLRYISPIVGYLWHSDKWQQELERVEKLVGR